MQLSKQVSFRTATIVADKAAAISHDSGIKHSELLRLAFSHGIKNAENVLNEMREDLTLEQALMLQSVGVDYT